MRIRPLLYALVAASLASLAQAQSPPPRQVDSASATSAGIREIRSRNLRLFTDLPASEGVDELPAAFDAAVPLWAEYFGVDPALADTWQVQGFLVKDREKFADLGLLPPSNRQFLNGFAHEQELWVEEQPSDYYRRHLLLHEGTHAFMLKFLGGCGPAWYMEGVAELLGTHRWNPASRVNRLTLGVVPARREEAPMWGRVKLIRDAVAAGQPLTLDQVLNIDNRRHLTTTEYSWSWAVASLLENNTVYRRPFHAMQKDVGQPGLADKQFNQRFRQRLGEENWQQLQLQWKAAVATIDYGYDHKQMTIAAREALPLTEGKQTSVDIAADRGWQSTGWQLTAGKTYRLQSSGRYRIVLDKSTTPPTPWPCEPGGITLQYNNGQPLGKLLAALVPSDPSSSNSAGEAGFFRPIAIGLDGDLKPAVDSVLYLRVNDHPARLGDNEGRIEVQIAPTATARQEPPDQFDRFR